MHQAAIVIELLIANGCPEIVFPVAGIELAQFKFCDCRHGEQEDSNRSHSMLENTV
jgi:hypothetical protein